jgi:hypothetical protein
MRMKTVGNKADLLAVVFHNAEASASIPLGTPVVLVMNGTNDGLDVVLPSTAGASKMHALAFGVSIGPVASGAYGEALIFGTHNNVVLTRQTRAASTVSWNSEASIASWGLLNIESVGNGMQTGGTLASTNFLPFAVLAQSLASYASSASATSDTRTAITAAVKAFLRII